MEARQGAPVVVATWPFGIECVTAAGEMIQSGHSSLASLVQGVHLVEMNEEVDSVGYGGRPNCEGVMQLDAALMDGPTRAAGGVMALEGFPSPILIANVILNLFCKSFIESSGFSTKHLLFSLLEKVQDNSLWLRSLKKQKLCPLELKRLGKNGKACKNMLVFSTLQSIKKINHPSEDQGHDTIGAIALDMKGDLAVGNIFPPNFRAINRL